MTFMMAPAGFSNLVQPPLGSVVMHQQCHQPQGLHHDMQQRQQQVQQQHQHQHHQQHHQQHQQHHPIVLMAQTPHPQPQYPLMQAPAGGSLDLYPAVESLYRDGLKPYGRILRKRLAEQAQVAGRGSAETDVNSLRAACEASPFLLVRDGEGGDWAALLPGVAEAFVDVYSPQDCYPQELWQELGNYFISLDGADMILPGGRYSCAQVLVQRRLPCLAACSLGQVCHIVQLAISQKKLLGYLNGMVVPYSRSLSMVKEQSAKCQRPCANTVRRSKSSAFATWDMMRPCLQQLLSSVGQPMPLSNVKRLFRAQFHVELSETALGYAKLSECLQDPRVRDLCDVKLQGQGYTIVPAKKPVQRSLISLADSLCMEPANTADLQDSAESSHRSSLLHKRRGQIQHLSMDVIHSPPSSPKGASQHFMLAVSPSASMRASACRGQICTTPVQTPFPPTPSPNAVSARSLPRLLGRVQAQQRPVGFGKETICKKDSGSIAVETNDVAATRGFDPLTPSTLSTMGLSVHNTFLHAPMPLPTPVRSNTRHRARSLPRQGIESR